MTRPLSITAVGNAQVSTSQSKFGGSSVALDGTGDYLNVNSTTELAFGTGDFCMEVWLYKTGGTSYHTIFDMRTSGSDGGGIILGINNVNQIYMYYNFNYRVLTAAINNNTWTHIALARVNGSTRVFINGTQSGSTYTDNNNYAQRGLHVGADPLGNYAFPGYMDEIRISKGNGRYSATFTPSTLAFANDADTSLLIHADGSNGSTTFIDDTVIYEQTDTDGLYIADSYLTPDGYYVYVAEGASSLTSTSSITVTAGVIKSAVSAMTVTTSVAATISNQKGADLFAFTDAALAAQVNLIRDNNIQASTAFNVAVEAVRGIYISAQADSVFTAAIANLRVRNEEAAIAAAFSLTANINAVRDLNIGAISDTFVQAADPLRVRFFDSAISATTTQTVASDSTKKFNANLTANSQITSTISHIHGADLFAFGDSTLTAQGKVNKTFAGAFDLNATQTVAAARTRDASATLNSEVNLSLVSAGSKEFDANLNAEFALSASITNIHALDLTAFTNATLTANAQHVHAASAAFNATASLTATGRVRKEFASSYGIVTASLTADFVRTRAVPAALDAQASLTSNITSIYSINLVAFNTSLLTADNSRTRDFDSAVSSNATVSALVGIIQQAASSLDANASFTGELVTIKRTDVTMSEAFSPSVVCRADKNLVSAMQSSASMTPAVNAQFVGTVSLTTTASITANATKTTPYWMGYGTLYTKTAIDVDSSGNIYTISGNSSSGTSVVKFDYYGNSVFQVDLTKSLVPSDIVLDSSNNIYISAASGYDSTSDALLFKFNSSGGLVWQRALSGNGNAYDSARAVALDSLGNPYVVGIANNTNAYIAKYNTSGVLQWQSAVNLSDPFISVAIDINDNIYAVNGSGYLTKWNTSGSLQWAKYNNSLSLEKVITDSQGNIYLQGSQNLYGAGGYDEVLTKLNSSGTAVWQKVIGTSSNEFGQGLAADADDNVYFSYYYSNTDIGLIKFKSDGTVLWQRKIDGGSSEYPQDISAKNNKLYLVGKITSTLPTNGSTPGTYSPYTYSETNVTISSGSLAFFSTSLSTSNPGFSNFTHVSVSSSVNNTGTLVPVTFTSNATELAASLSSSASLTLSINKITKDSVVMSSAFEVFAIVDPLGSPNIQWVHDQLPAAYNATLLGQPHNSGKSLQMNPYTDPGGGNSYYWRLEPTSASAYQNFQPGSQDFCLEFWLGFNDSWNYTRTVMDSAGIKIEMNPSGSSQQRIIVTISDTNGNTTQIVESLGGYTAFSGWTMNAMHYLAITRKGSQFSLYFKDAYYTDSFKIGSSTNATIGALGNTISNTNLFTFYPFKTTDGNRTMYLDEFRWSYGSSRYNNANFYSLADTVFRPDQYTQALFHFDNNLIADFGIVFGSADDLFTSFALTANVRKFSVIQGAADLTSTAALSVDAIKAKTIIAHLNTSATVNATINATHSQQAALSSSSNLVTLANSVNSASAALGAVVSEMAVTGKVLRGVADITASFALSATATKTTQHQGAAALTSSATITCSVIIGKIASAALTSRATLFALSGKPVNGAAALSSRFTLTTSPRRFYLDPDLTWIVPAEVRSWKVSSETRSYTVESETREYIIKE